MHNRRRMIAGSVAAALLLLGLPVLAGAPAQAAQPRPNHTRLVPVTPRTDTAKINDGEILDIEVVGSRVFIAGSFTSLTNPGGGTVAQRWLAAYNIDTGRVDTTFRPTFDGAISAVEASPDGTSLYVAGSFNTVGGQAKRKIVRLNPTNGAPVAAFTANANARATALAVSNTTLYVGGQFATVNNVARPGLVAVNRLTGAVDTGFNLPLSGGIGVGGLLSVQQLKLTHDDAKLLVVHTGRQIAGLDRYGVGLIDTATKSLLPWRTRLWEDNLSFVGGIQRIYAGDISPDDSYFVVTSGSGGDRPPINDTAVAFSVAGGDDMQPRWVSRHFDSVYSVAITEQAVYVGGHFQWQESATSAQPWPGRADVGYGTGQGLGAYALGDQVVRRDHLGALDPATGTALDWNPGSNSFQGDKAMEATPRGLFVGGDGQTKGGASTGRVAFFDFNRAPAASPVDTVVTAPIEGRVATANQPLTITGTAVAPAGITRVQVEIQNRGSRRYLQDDLVTWGTANTINTTVATVNATASTWQITVSLPVGEYQVLAKTFGRNNTSDPTKAVRKFETFSFDDLPPSTSISSPSSGLLATTTFTATGTASDDKGIVALTYLFRDGSNRYLQEDGTVAATYHTFRGEPDVVGATSTTWRYDVTLPHEGEWRLTVTSIDTAGHPDLRGDTRDWLVSTTGVAPVASITSPVQMTPPAPTPTLTATPGSTVTFTGTATDDEQVRLVEVYLRNNTTREALAADGSWSVDSVAGLYRISPINLNAPTFNWTFTTPQLTPGVYDFRVRVTDNLGLSASQARVSLVVQVPGDAFPNGLLSATGTNQDIDALHLDLAGTATDDKGVAAVRIALRDLDTGRYVQPNGTMAGSFAVLPASLASPGATSTAFSLSVNLPTKGTFTVEAWAVDTSGQQDGSTSGATARYLVYPGDADPTLEAAGAPQNGTVYTDGRIVVNGRAIDDVGMGRVEVLIVNSAGQSMSSGGTFSSGTRWLQAFLTSPGSPGSNFAYTSPLVPAGTYTVTVRAVDIYGQVQPAPRVATVTVT